MAAVSSTNVWAVGTRDGRTLTLFTVDKSGGSLTLNANVEVDQALARLVSKNTSYHSCLVHCLLKGTMVITGLIKDRSLLVKFVLTMATSACWCGRWPIQNSG